MILELENLVGIVLIVALAILAVKLRAMDLSGAISGALISFVAFLAGDFSWLLIIVIFVGVSSALTRYKYDYKRKLGVAQDKMGVRSWPNSVANGGVSVIAAVGEILTHSNIFAVMFVTSVATAMADTLATEIGLLSHSQPRLITHPSKHVPSGTSGGISLLGDIAALLSTVCMALIGIGLSVFEFVDPSDLRFAVIIVILGGTAGVFFDSFLGATIQQTNRCTVCGNLTENSHHHDHPTELARGVKYFDNNVVNFIGVLFGSAISIALYMALVAV